MLPGVVVAVVPGGAAGGHGAVVGESPAGPADVRRLEKQGTEESFSLPFHLRHHCGVLVFSVISSDMDYRRTMVSLCFLLSTLTWTTEGQGCPCVFCYRL